MHFGSLPERASSTRLDPDLTSLVRVDRAVSSDRNTSRRQWLAGLGGFSLGVVATCGTIVGHGLLGGPANADAGDAGGAETGRATGSDQEGPASAPAPRGSLDWALRLRVAPADQLLQAAGDLEIVSTSHPAEPSLVPVFDRLLEVAMASELPIADQAAACAIRAIGRLGATDLIELHRRAIQVSLDRPLTRQALERADRRTTRRRRSR